MENNRNLDVMLLNDFVPRVLLSLLFCFFFNIHLAIQALVNLYTLSYFIFIFS